MIDMLVNSNLPEFRRQLEAMDRKVRTRAVRRAVSSAARIFRKHVQAAAPIYSGTLARAIYSKRSRRSSATSEISFVSVRSGAKYGRLRKSGLNKDAFYWAWVEQGHLARGPGSRITGGANTKRLKRSRAAAAGGQMVAPRPFLAPGFRTGGAAALAEFTRVMEAEISKAAK